jgi:MFS family permease
MGDNNDESAFLANASGSRGARGVQKSNNFPMLQNPVVAVLMKRSPVARLLVNGSPTFRLLMFGTSISMLGTRISTVATPMLVLYLNKSPSIAGLFTFASVVPSMLIYLPGGALVDRWNPRRVMLVSEISRGITVASVVVALWIYQRHASVWFLIIAMIAEETLEVFSILAERRYLSTWTERDKTVHRQASVEFRTHGAALAGRLAGPFIFALQPILPYVADAISFVASTGSLLLLRKMDEQRWKPPQPRPMYVTHDIRQGFRWLRRHRPALLAILLMAMTSMVAQALIIIFLVEAHSRQLSTPWIGIVLAASGAGGAIGSCSSRAVLAAVKEHWLPVQMIAWSLALACLLLARSQSAYLDTFAMFTLGFTGATGNVNLGTYLVRNVADGMIAKVTSIGQMLAMGGYALGPLLGGYFIQHLQVRGAIFVLLMIMVLLAVVSLVRLDDPQPDEVEPLLSQAELSGIQ